MSEPHRAVASTLTSTSFGRMEGIGTSTRSSPGSRFVFWIAFIIPFIHPSSRCLRHQTHFVEYRLESAALIGPERTNRGAPGSGFHAHKIQRLFDHDRERPPA